MIAQVKDNHIKEAQSASVHMQICYNDAEIQNAKESQNKLSKYPNSKRDTSHPTHPSTSQRWSDLGVWLGYRLAGFWTQHGLGQ